MTSPPTSHATQRSRSWLAVLIGTLCGAAPAGAQAPAPERPPRELHLAVRLGAAISTPLVEDSVAPGARAVTAKPGVAPVLGASAWISVRERMDVEVELGWSGVDLRADDGAAEWTADDLDILYGAVLVRLRATERFHARGGLGVVRYSGDREGGFLRGDAQIHPYVTAGLGAGTDVGRYLLFAEASAQVHRFTFRELREEGGEQGLVWRGLLQAGVALPLGGGS